MEHSHAAEIITAVSSLISALAWPATTAFAVYVFTPEVKRGLLRLHKFSAFGIEGELSNEISSAELIANKTGKPSERPTREEIKKSEKVEGIVDDKNSDIVFNQVNDLSREYESVRTSMPPGDERTKVLEVVVSKMRVLGLAASRFRYELTSSPSPGKRLQAIVSLQVRPDYDLVEWLARRPTAEQPFIAYHALSALVIAAESANAALHGDSLRQALKILEAAISDIDPGGRRDLFDRFRRRVSSLNP